MSISNLKCFGVEPDESENQLEVIELLDGKESEENFDDPNSDKAEEQQDPTN